MIKVNSRVCFKMKRRLWKINTMTDTSPTFVMWSRAWKSCNYSASTGRKGGCGNFGDFDKSCKRSDLWPAVHRES